MLLPSAPPVVVPVAEEAEARADELAERLKYAEKLLAGREVTA